MEDKSPKGKHDLKYRTYGFSLHVIAFIDTLDKKDFIVEIMAKQLLRSATSVGANVIEAQAGSSKKDFTNFFCYALKSANETKFWLSLFRDSWKAPKEKVSPLFQEAVELANILASSIITLRGKK